MVSLIRIGSAQQFHVKLCAAGSKLLFLVSVSPTTTEPWAHYRLLPNIIGLPSDICRLELGSQWSKPNFHHWLYKWWKSAQSWYYEYSNWAEYPAPTSVWEPLLPSRKATVISFSFRESQLKLRYPGRDWTALSLTTVFEWTILIRRPLPLNFGLRGRFVRKSRGITTFVL